MIAVVIPYFQRQQGILARALASIAAQRDCSFPIHVIVVDDSSPIPPIGEVDAVAFPPNIRVQVVSRPNGGPGAARNTGLEHASNESEYVAFLDSDDEWTTDHLVRATTALARGYDFYFSDHQQLGQTVGAFSRAQRLRTEDHLGLGDDLHEYSGDMFDQVLRGNVIGTSTVVYRLDRLRDSRFKVQFKTAGEDYLFWMEVVRKGVRIAFSSRIEARYGRGINVYSGSGWGTDGFALRVHNELMYRKAVEQMFQLTPEQHAFVRAALSRLRRAYAQDLLHRVVHRKPIDRELLCKQLSADPTTFLEIPLVLFRKALGTT